MCRLKVFKQNKGANCFQLAPFGCGDPTTTNFYIFYRGFNEIGLLQVEHVFERPEQFALGVLLGFEAKCI